MSSTQRVQQGVWAAAGAPNNKRRADTEASERLPAGKKQRLLSVQHQHQQQQQQQQQQQRRQQQLQLQHQHQQQQQQLQMPVVYHHASPSAAAAAAHQQQGFLASPDNVANLLQVNAEMRHQLELHKATIAHMAQQLEAQGRELAQATKELEAVRRGIPGSLAVAAEPSTSSLASEDVDDQSLSHMSSTAAQLLHRTAAGSKTLTVPGTPPRHAPLQQQVAAPARRRSSSEQQHGGSGSVDGGASRGSSHSGRKSSSVCNLCGNDIQKDNMPGHLRNACPVARQLQLLQPRIGGGAPKATDTVQCRCGISLTNKNLPRHVQYACSATAEWRRKAAERQGLDGPPVRSSPPRGSRASPSRSDASGSAVSRLADVAASPMLAASLPSRKTRSPKHIAGAVPSGAAVPPPLMLPPSKPEGLRITPLPDASPSLAVREREVPSFLLELKGARSAASPSTA